MRILVVYQYFCTPKGSWSTRIYELTKRWVVEGHEVEVITSPYEKSDLKANGFISQQEVDGVDVTIINTSDSNRNSKFIRAIKAMLFAVLSSYYVLTKNYDVIIASSGPITVGFPLILAKIFRGKRGVFEVRDLWPAGGIEMGKIKNPLVQKVLLWFERQCYSYADKVATASRGQMDYIKERYPDLKIFNSPNASDNDLFDKIKSPHEVINRFQGKVVLTHIGSIGYIHNVKFWVDLASAFQVSSFAKQYHFLFIGDGADKAKLEKLTEERGLTNVEFLGLLPKSQLPEWLGLSHATLFATLDNKVQDACSPNKIFDSFAAGKPIIQTSNGWIKDLVENEGCGLNVSLNNIKEAMGKIVDFFSNENQLIEAGINAKRLAKTEFDRDFIAGKYLKELEDLLRK